MVEPALGMLPVFAETRLRVHPDDYVVVSLPPDAGPWARGLRLEPFSSVTHDRDEVSLVLKSSEWARRGAEARDARVEGPYTLITFDIVLDLSLVGYLSVVSALLAENGISIYALSTFLRDHILVRKGDAGRAVELLEGLVERSRQLLVKG